MSDVAEISEELVLDLQTTFVQNCCFVAAASLVVYDHITTFSHEMQYIWGRKWNSVTALFHLNRWLILVYTVISLPIGFLPLPSIKGCTAANYLLFALTLMLYVIWAAFLAIRVYAVGSGSWKLAILVFLLSIVPVGTNIWSNFFDSFAIIEDIPVLGLWCIFTSNASPALNIRLTVGTRACVITSDVIVLLVTWLKTFPLKREADRANIKSPLATMLLRDGTIYFIVLLALNVLELAGTVRTNVFLYASTFLASPLSSIFISHFLINLRQTAKAPIEDGLGSQRPSFVHPRAGERARSYDSSLRFAGVVDNMGELLEHNAELTDAAMSWEEDACQDGRDTDAPAEPMFDDRAEVV
ncbi:hypothetical protein OBBRIDRAFT_487305 [Obba rivulosa]|uniref:DUF6533 domain-containing protein n=1 Tax=Obba rivulosa TaxID=1052685 RepID=A0A8E2B0X9_9APHY|nr:hypothetical protein OBBRIDRAFT_487305 [Obba rivulosa]